MSDLAIYKIDVLNHTLGLRWMCPDDKNSVKFTYSFDYNVSEYIPLEPQYCSAWPKYYCKTIDYSNNNNNFSIKVNIK